MQSILTYVSALVWSGWTSLLDYLAAHVLLCLLPAFVIAGYMSAMIPKETITQFLGPRAKKWISYPAAAVGGFILAVCSCTILPLFAGIWKRGAGLGAAITFLFVGPAVNILAIAYTGAAIGFDIALARIILSILFGIGIGLLMAWFFRAEERQRAQRMAASGPFDGQAQGKPAVWALFALLFAVLIVGTLQVELLTSTWVSVELPVSIGDGLQTALGALNLSIQGALLILLLLLLTPIAILGLENVLTEFNRWTHAAIGLTVATVLVAAPTLAAGSLVVNLTGRFFGELLLIGAIGSVASRSFERDEIAEWLWETWKFVKQIFQLGAEYKPAAPALRWRKAGHTIVFHPLEIVVSNLADRGEAEQEVRELIELANGIWERRAEIEPSQAVRRRPSHLAIFKLLPGANCRDCGQATCHNFALRIATGQANPSECPKLTEMEHQAARSQLEDLLASV